MNLAKYKLLGVSALLLLAVSSVVTTGILFSLNILLLPSVIISSVAFLGIVIGLAFFAAISKISQKNSEIGEKIFKKLKTAYESKNIKELKSLLDSSNEKIRNFLEKQDEDELGTPFLHKIILLRNKEILQLLCNNIPDLDWGVKNKNDQTILHIIAEKEDIFLANEFQNYDQIKSKLDPNIKDVNGRTPGEITKEKNNENSAEKSKALIYLYNAINYKGRTLQSTPERY